MHPPTQVGSAGEDLRPVRAITASVEPSIYVDLVSASFDSSRREGADPMTENPFLDAVPDAQQTWIVVCADCLRTRHDGQWTDVRVMGIHGRATDVCDECVQRGSRGSPAS
jgi:hypothetical protein